MAKYHVSGQTPVSLVNGGAIVSIVPAAAVGLKILRCWFGSLNAGGAPSDLNIGVGINRATTRGTPTTTLTGVKADPDSGPSVITGADSAWSAQPTLAATDLGLLAYNSRGGTDTPTPLGDISSTVGTANPIVFVNRTGAALGATTTVAYWVEWEE